jgi:hypothetical protein
VWHFRLRHRRKAHKGVDLTEESELKDNDTPHTSPEVFVSTRPIDPGTPAPLSPLGGPAILRHETSSTSEPVSRVPSPRSIVEMPPPYIIEELTAPSSSQHTEISTSSQPRTVQPESDDAWSLFTAQHRDIITPTVAQKLRDAGYAPYQNPDILSQETWREAGIGVYTVQVLRNLYQQ